MRSNKEQYTSSLTSISFGVPQGSILGPLPLILFVNDLPLHITQNLDLYADDSTLHSSGNSIKELNDTLSSALENSEQWSESNGWWLIASTLNQW